MILDKEFRENKNLVNIESKVIDNSRDLTIHI